MKRLAWMVIIMALVVGSATAGEYRGRYCAGIGDTEYLRMIDQSFGYFHPNPDTPNISMLYYPDWDCLVEGFPSWLAWWVQNSYGTTYCSLPFLQEPWVTFVQHSQDLWFASQGDGKKHGYEPFAELVGPEGSLCDCATPEGAIYRQGDYNWRMHDWGFEFTAAGVVMQAELLLIQHDKAVARKYLPNLERACSFVETCRDPKNNLFLVGPGANLLAPSYGGIKQADGTFGKGYLAGLSITYLAACDRMIELEKLAGHPDKVALFEHRRKITRESLPQLVTPEGYFVKSIETNGTKHGVYGQAKYGYFEGVANIDAVCFRAADDVQAGMIYDRIASIPKLRPYDFLITNYPSLDDTYVAWDNPNPGELFEFGRWVNGGFWSTVEARAIMAYYRLGKWEDIRRSNQRSAKLAADYQMDAPLTNFGSDVWFKDRQTNLCYDALGIPAATVRGLLEYIYRANDLVLYPHVPSTIQEYTQKELVRFGDKRLMFTVRNGGPKVMALKVNDTEWPVTASDHVVLPYDKLPLNSWVEIVMGGGKSKPAPEGEVADEQYPPGAPVAVEYPDSLKKPYDTVIAMEKELCKESDVAFERAYVEEMYRAFRAYRDRASRQAGGWYPKFTPEKQAAVLKMYEDAALNLYKGFDALMARYASGDSRQKRLARIYAKCRGENG